MKQTLFLMVGFPGSGKTTAARIIKDQTGAIHLWADEVRRNMFGRPDHTHKENLKLYDHLNDITAKLLADGKSVIFDTNFNFYKDREKLRAIADRYGSQSVVVWVVAPRDLARQRAVHESDGKDTRVFGNMPLEHFDRIVRNLQPPRENEHVIKLDGTKITPEYIKDALAGLG